MRSHISVSAQQSKMPVFQASGGPLGRRTFGSSFSISLISFSSSRMRWSRRSISCVELATADRRCSICNIGREEFKHHKTRLHCLTFGPLELLWILLVAKLIFSIKVATTGCWCLKRDQGTQDITVLPKSIPSTQTINCLHLQKDYDKKVLSSPASERKPRNTNGAGGRRIPALLSLQRP